MQSPATPRRIVPVDEHSYDAPELMSIGAASNVIMGLPGGGFDGAYGMSEPPFEFEADELE
jgi:hypothetical protein